jgi:hypothetical protein
MTTSPTDAADRALAPLQRMTELLIRYRFALLAGVVISLVPA